VTIAFRQNYCELRASPRDSGVCPFDKCNNYVGGKEMKPKGI